MEFDPRGAGGEGLSGKTDALSRVDVPNECSVKCLGSPLGLVGEDVRWLLISSLLYNCPCIGSTQGVACHRTVG